MLLIVQVYLLRQVDEPESILKSIREDENTHFIDVVAPYFIRHSEI